MNIVEIINKKKNKGALSREEINFAIEKYMTNEIEDYQMSALLMAILLNNMNEEETIYLTEAFVNTGDVIDFSNIDKPIVDKHSTGGVGDKTSLVLIPLLAACDLVVAKMSGRGLGHTGGTIDKLESIEGFSVELDDERFKKQVEEHGLALIGQTENLVPADKRIYALRDVTSTVDSIPLIAASIMSKKIAAGAQYIVLDVKYGSGAFMKTKEDAELLGSTLVKIGNGVGRKTIAVISSMQEPLGYAIGNSLEVNEAIDTLKGTGPKDLLELSIILAAEFLVITNKAKTYEEARETVTGVINDGTALQKLVDLVTCQDGSVDSLFNLEVSPHIDYVLAEDAGYVNSLSALELGITSMLLGAGRQTKKDVIDVSVGIKLCKKIGDEVKVGDVLCEIYHNNKTDLTSIEKRIKDAFVINDVQAEEIKLVEQIIR